MTTIFTDNFWGTDIPSVRVRLHGGLVALDNLYRNGEVADTMCYTPDEAYAMAVALMDAADTLGGPTDATYEDLMGVDLPEEEDRIEDLDIVVDDECPPNRVYVINPDYFFVCDENGVLWRFAA